MSKFRHNCCGGKNCYIEMYKAPIEDFDEDLPGTCQYTDLDAFVESGRHYLITEFKKEIDAEFDHMPPGGQRLSLERLSKDLPRSTVWLVDGNSPQRECKRIRVCINGIWGEWEDIDWAELKRRHRAWIRESLARANALAGLQGRASAKYKST